MALGPFLTFYFLGIVLAALGSGATTAFLALGDALRLKRSRDANPKAALICLGLMVGCILVGMVVVWFVESYGRSVKFEGTMGLVGGAIVPGMGLLLSVPHQQAWLLKRLRLSAEASDEDKPSQAGSAQ
ncbi:MAG: hypothetical protein ACFB21_05145 [Opitutales bacterium]